MSFQDQMQYLQEANDCLEKELDRLKSDLTRALDCLDEETKTRCDLECCVTDLKQEINEIDGDLCCVTVERDQLLAQLEDLMKRLESCQNAKDALQLERDELQRNCLLHKDTVNKSSCLQGDLQQALADCCKATQKK